MKINKLLIIFVVIVILVISNWRSDERKKAMLSDNDFDNDDEGAIMFWTSINIPKENLDSDYLLFFVSERIKGLRIIYDFRDWRLKGGIPLLNSEEEINFDGKQHYIAYTFKKNGKQVLYFDGNPVAEGLFIAEEPMQLTGFVVYDDREAMDASYEASDVRVYDKSLSEEEIKEMFSK